MERTVHTPDTYDFRQYDQVWQRVGPGLEPYAATRMADLPGLTAPGAALAETDLPGAQADPCCMGSAAEEMLAVLTGFIEEELADRRYYQAMVRCAPAWARQRLRDIGTDAGTHARRLAAVYYLITGEVYRAAVSCDRVYVGQWRAALRERYHAEACTWMNYIRAAEGTTDPCLARLLTAMGEDERRHADALMAMLARSLT